MSMGVAIDLSFDFGEKRLIAVPAPHRGLPPFRNIATAGTARRNWHMIVISRMVLSICPTPANVGVYFVAAVVADWQVFSHALFLPG